MRTPSKPSRPPEASSRRRSSRLWSATQPWPFVVRSSVSSWVTTMWSSRVSCTSSSIASAPCSIAISNAGRVFSGADPLAPRWAQTFVTRPIVARAGATETVSPRFGPTRGVTRGVLASDATDPTGATMDSARLYSAQIAAVLDPGEVCLAALLCQYAPGEEHTRPVDDTVTFDPLNGLSVPAWERAAGAAIGGVTLVGAPGSSASGLVGAMTRADHLILTDRRLAAASLGAEPALSWWTPRAAVAQVRVDPRQLQRGRLRIVFADGSMARVLAGLLLNTEARRFEAAAAAS